MSELKINLSEIPQDEKTYLGFGYWLLHRHGVYREVGGELELAGVVGSDE